MPSDKATSNPFPSKTTGSIGFTVDEATIENLKSSTGVITNLSVTNLNAASVISPSTSAGFFQATDATDQFRTATTNMDFKTASDSPVYTFKGSNSSIVGALHNGKRMRMSDGSASFSESLFENTSTDSGSEAGFRLKTPAGSVTYSMDQESLRGVVRTYAGATGIDTFVPDDVLGFTIYSVQGGVDVPVFSAGNAGIQAPEMFIVGNGNINQLTVPSSTLTNTLTVGNTDEATTATAPTLHSGGVLIRKKCYADQFIATSVTDSATTTTGAITTAGGLGVAKTIRANAIVSSTSMGAATISATTVTATNVSATAAVTSGLNSLTPAGLTLVSGGILVTVGNLTMTAGNIVLDVLFGIGLGTPAIPGTISAPNIVVGVLTSTTSSVLGNASVAFNTTTGTLNSGVSTFTGKVTVTSAAGALGLDVATNTSIGGSLTTGTITGTGATFSTDVGVVGFLKVGNASTPGRLKFAANNTDYTLLGVNSSDDSTNTRIIISGSARSGNAGVIQYVSVGAGSTHDFLGNGSTIPTGSIRTGFVTLSGTGTALSITNNASIGNTLTTANVIVGGGGRLKLATSTADTTLLGVDNADGTTNTSITLYGTTEGTNPGGIKYKSKGTGIHTFWGTTTTTGPFTETIASSILQAGTLALQGAGTALNISNNANITGNLTVGGTQTVGSIDVLGSGNGLIVENDALVKGNLVVNGTATSFSGTVSVTGTSTLGAITASSITLTGASTGLNVTNNALIGGTLGVTGLSTLGNVNSGPHSATTLTATGAGTGLAVTNNATVGGTLGVTGITTTGVLNSGAHTATTLTATGAGTALSVTNNATIGGNLTVTGTLSSATSSPSSLTVSGNATVGGTLGVTGISTLGVVNSAAHSATTLTATGAGTALSVTNNATIAGILTLSSVGGTALVVTNNGSFGNNITVGGNATISNNCIVSNNLNVNGAGTALTVNNNATVQGNLTVNGSFNGGVTSWSSASGNSLSLTGGGTSLTVNNNATIGGTLGVTGITTTGVLNSGAHSATTLTATGAGTALTVTNNASIGTVTIGTGGIVNPFGLTNTGNAVFSGGVTVNGAGNAFVVTNNATIGGTLGTGAISGTSATFSTDVGVVGFLKVGNAATPGRLRFASSSTDYTLLGTQSLDDGTNTRIILCASANPTFPGTIQYISVGSGSNHDFYGNGTTIATGSIRTGFVTLSGTGTALSVTNNATIGGNLTVTGTINSAALSPSSLTTTGNATVGGTLGVTGNTTLTGTLTVNGGGNAFVVTNNATIGGTLGTGAITGTSATFSGDVGVVGFLKVGNAATPGRLRFASSSTDYTLLGTQSLDDGTNTRIILCASAHPTFPGTIQYVSVGSGSNHDFLGSATTIATGSIRTGFVTLSGTGTALSVTTNATVGGTLGITGLVTGTAATFSTDVGVVGFLKVGNASTPGRLRFAANNTDYTLLGVNSSDDATNTRIIISGSARSGNAGVIQYVSMGSGSTHDFFGNGTLLATGSIRTGFLTLSGAGTALAVTNNATIGGTLGVGDTINATKATGTGLAVTAGATIGGSLTMASTIISSTAINAFFCNGSGLFDRDLYVTGFVQNGGFDFKVGSADQTTRGNSGLSRALTKDGGATLVINYAGDFPGGVRIDSPVKAPQFIKSDIYNGGAQNGTITFATPFATIPVVAVSVSTTTTIAIGNITTTSFDFARTSGVTVNFYWIATTAGNV